MCNNEFVIIIIIIIIIINEKLLSGVILKKVIHEITCVQLAKCMCVHARKRVFGLWSGDWDPNLCPYPHFGGRGRFHTCTTCLQVLVLAQRERERELTLNIASLPIWVNQSYAQDTYHSNELSPNLIWRDSSKLVCSQALTFCVSLMEVLQS